ncbi:MAG: hypothetical protein ACI9F9_000718 [Candidatus Paceibacteria bacterium]|jgi:hypothetical protein
MRERRSQVALEDQIDEGELKRLVERLIEFTMLQGLPPLVGDIWIRMLVAPHSLFATLLSPQ